MDFDEYEDDGSKQYRLRLKHKVVSGLAIIGGSVPDCIFGRMSRKIDSIDFSVDRPQVKFGREIPRYRYTARSAMHFPYSHRFLRRQTLSPSRCMLPKDVLWLSQFPSFLGLFQQPTSRKIPTMPKSSNLP